MVVATLPGNTDPVPTAAIPAVAVAALIAQHPSGLTPLHYAVQSGNVDVVELLLRFECLDPMVLGATYHNRSTTFLRERIFDCAILQAEEGTTNDSTTLLYQHLISPPPATLALRLDH